MPITACSCARREEDQRILTRDPECKAPRHDWDDMLSEIDILLSGGTS